MSDKSPIGILLLQFSLMSLLAFGGASSVVPEMYHQTVQIHHWLEASEFSSLFAISQTIPGPNVLVVTLIGWRVAGLLGAFVTTFAMCVPSSILSFMVARLWGGVAKIDQRKKILRDQRRNSGRCAARF